MSVELMNLGTAGSCQREYDGSIHSGDLPPRGIRLILRIIVPMMTTKERTKESQKPRRIRGPSMESLERSTFFLVACQVMLYEKRCARRVVERWILRQPKNKKLQNSKIHE
jgi:hypothetical protein